MKINHLLIFLLLAALTPLAANAQTSHLYTSYTATAGVSNLQTEAYPNLVDNNINTKWCVNDLSSSSNLELYIEFQSAEPIIPVGYVLTTGNDNATWTERNPKDWTIKAKANPNDAWTTIATVTNDQVLQDINHTAYEFTADNPNHASYQYFRFDVSAIHSGSCFQLAELRFLVADPLPELPYFTDFETTCDWQFVNGGLTNVWTWGTAAHNGAGTHGLYISNDGGATNAYNNTNNNTMVYAYKTFLFDTGIYNFSYDWNANGENNYDFLRVALVPATVNLEAGTALPSGFSYSALPSGWIALDGGSQLNQASVWNTMSQEIEIATAGSYMMVFAWRNDNSVGTNPPAAIDNVSIEVVACPTPLNLSVSNLTATTADLGWTGSILTDSYTVKYRRSEIIFTEGFEDGTMPSGWTQSGPGTWNVTQGYGSNSIGTHSGTYNATINHTSREDETFLVTPMLDLSGQIGLCLNFWYINFNWGSADIDQLYVYYRVNEGEWIELWNTTEDHQEWTESGFIPLPNPSANYQIGFKMIDKYGHGVGLDDIMIGHDIATGAWQTSTVAGNATEMSTTLTGLTPETEYEAYVYPDCNPDNVSEMVRFTTANEQTLTIETIGTGTYSSSMVFPGLYNYQYTVSLYKPDMAGFLNDDFNLSSIAYDVTSSNATIDTLTIWVKDVDESEYTISSYISQYNSFSSYLEGATQVYASTTSFNLTAGWNTFNFTTNFSHRAGKALLVIVRGVSNNTVGSSDCPLYRYTYKPNTVWYTRRNYNLGYPGSGENDFNGDLANIQLGLTYATGIPSDLTVTYPEGIDTQVTLGWTENGEATAWQICLNDDETNLIEANSNPFTLTNLAPETTYTAKVRANHGDTQSDWSTAVSFTPTLKTVLGTATGTIGFLPCNPNYEYSMTQQIYTAAELGNAADLVSIDFYNDGTDVTTRNLQIYMTHTDQNAFASLYYDWINVASTDLVFSGPVHFVSKGWKSIVLDKPFAYDGQHNVVITVDDNTGSYDYQSGVKFLCYSVPGAGLQSKYFNDVYNHNYDPTNNPGSSTYALNQKNHIRVMKAYAPTDLTVSDVTTNMATLGWTENGTANSWQICLNGNMNDLITVTENPYTLTNLIPNPYTAKVRAICAEGHTSWSNEVSFMPGDWAIIGSGTETNNYLPFRCYRNYSVTQQIYTNEELGAPGFIQSIDFFKTGTMECSRNIDIYMIHTDLDDYASQTDNWIPVNSNNLVFSGTVTFGDNCWTTITLDTPFAYDGLHNVAIVIDDNTGSFITSEVPFLSFTTATEQGFYTSSFTDNFPPTSMPESAWGIVNQKNQIRVMKLAPEALPYSTGFETTCDWTFVNGSCTNAWAWGTAAYAEGSHGLYISNDGGTTNAYTNTSEAMVYAYKTFYLEEGMYCFSYLWRAVGQGSLDFHFIYGYCDYLRVVLVPASVSLEASTSTFAPSDFGPTTLPEGWIAIDYGSRLNQSPDWSNVFTCIEVPATGYYNMNMVFAWRNNNDSGSNPPAAIDDVVIEATSRPHPGSLTSADVRYTTTELSWNEYGTPSSWQICLNDDETNLIEATSNPFHLKNLSPETTYTAKVRATYGDEHTDWSDPTSFTTLPALEVPYFYDFQVSINYPGAFSFYNKWKLVSGQYEPFYLSIGSSPHSNPNSRVLYLPYSNSIGGELPIVAMPYFADNINNYTLEFWMKLLGVYSGPLDVGYMTDIYDASTFMPVRTFDNVYYHDHAEWNEGNYAKVSMTFEGVPDGAYIAFRGNGQNSGYWQVDDVNLTVVSSDYPIDLTFHNITTTSAELQWNGPLNAESYRIWMDEVEKNIIEDYFDGNSSYDWTFVDCIPTTGIFPGYGGLLIEPTENIQYLISPELTGLKDDMSLIFNYETWYNYFISFQVGYSSTDMDTTSFTFGPVITRSNALGPRTFTELIPPGTKYFCIKFIPSSKGAIEYCAVGYSYRPKIFNLEGSHTEQYSYAYNGHLYHNAFTFTELKPDTEYDIILSSIINGIYYDSPQRRFRTQVDFYSTDFDSICDWALINGSCTNAWTWGTAAGNGDTQGLYISNDGGTSNAYTNTRSAMVYATKTLDFEAGVYHFSFDWKANGQSNYDYLRVALVPATVNLQASTSKPSGFGVSTLPAGWIALDGGSKLNGSTVWQTVDNDIMVPADGAYKMVLAWWNNSSGGSNPPAAIDNVSIYPVACPIPANITLGELSPTTATLHWDGSETMGSYIMRYRVVGTYVWQTKYVEGGTSHVIGIITDLTPGTQYEAQVQSDCDNALWSESICFTTEAYDYLLDRDFDSVCEWTLINGSCTNAWAWGNAVNNNSTNCLYISNDGGVTYACNYLEPSAVYAVSNALAFEDGWHHFSYDYNCANLAYGDVDFLRMALIPASVQLEADTIPPDGLEARSLPSGWIALDGGHRLYSQGNWLSFNGDAYVPTSGNYRVVLIWVNTRSTWHTAVPGAIDNFKAYYMPCQMPFNVTVDNVTASTANLSWTGTTGMDGYTVRYRPDAHSQLELIIDEGFENGHDGWALVQNSVSDWIQYNSHSGQWSFRFSYDPNNTDHSQYLITPELSDVTDGMKLEFYVQNHNMEYIGAFCVGFSSTDDAIESFTFGNRITPSGMDWNLYSFDIPAGTKFVCFRNDYTDNAIFMLYFDDIYVGAVSPEQPWQTMTVEGNAIDMSATLTGLIPNTRYEFQVKNSCEASEWTASLNFNTLDGTLTKEIAGYGTGNGNWYLIATPIANANPTEVTGMTDGDYDLYRFSPTHEDNEWENYKDTPYSLVNGQGYLYAHGTDVTLAFLGTPVAGNDPIEMPLAYDATDDHKCWNLVGNPFACEATINKESYVLNADGTGINPVAVSASTPIPPCAAVFVKATGAGQTVVFTKVVP